MILAIQAIDGYETMTPQEIADALNATHVTRSPIELGELLFLLNQRGMLVRLIRPADTGEKWTGTVVDMIMFVNANVPAMAGGVNQWFSHITNDRNHLFDTSMVEYGPQLKALETAFGGQPGMPTVDDFAAIADLGGGWKYGGVTATEVQTALDQLTKQNLIDACTMIWTTKANNAAASLGSEYIDDLTIAELETRIAAVNASVDGLVA